MMPLARCSWTGQSGEAIGGSSNCFEGKRFIVYRGKQVPNDSLDYIEKIDELPWYLFTIPINSLDLTQINTHQNQNQNQNINLNLNLNQNQNQNLNYREKQKQIENHSLRHTLPYHFNFPYIPIPTKFADLYEASWAVLGSTVYLFGAAGRKIYYLDIKEDGSTLPFTVKLKSAGYTISQRRAPKLVSLGNRIYVFEFGDNSVCEVFEPYPDRRKGQSMSLSSPIPSCDFIFAVAMEAEGKIVVGCNYEIGEDEDEDEPTTDIAIFVYDVVGDLWVKHENNLSHNLRGLSCQPIVVGSCLYWLDTKMCAYDIDTKQSFEGPVEDCLFQRILETEKTDTLTISMFHLVGNFFQVTWTHFFDYKVLHCMTVHVHRTTTNLQSNHFKLRTSVVSCQTFASRLYTFLQGGALIL